MQNRYDVQCPSYIFKKCCVIRCLTIASTPVMFEKSEHTRVTQVLAFRSTGWTGFTTGPPTLKCQNEGVSKRNHIMPRNEIK